MSEMDIIRKWFEKAEDDLIVATHVFENLYPKQIEISCYHAQQAVEKVLKGFLIHSDVDAPKSHNLVALCQLCSNQNESFSAFMAVCAELTPYGVMLRYPNSSDISEEKARMALRAAKEIYDVVVSLIPGLTRPE